MCFIIHDWYYSIDFANYIAFDGNSYYIFRARTCRKCHTHQLKYNHSLACDYRGNIMLDMFTISSSAIDWLDVSCEHFEKEIRLFHKIIKKYPITHGLPDCKYYRLSKKKVK